MDERHAAIAACALAGEYERGTGGVVYVHREQGVMRYMLTSELTGSVREHLETVLAEEGARHMVVAEESAGVMHVWKIARASFA